MHMPDDLTFNNAYLLEIIRDKAKFRFQPISWSETDQESNAKLLSQSLKILKLLINFLLNKKPLNTKLALQRNYTFEIIWRIN